MVKIRGMSNVQTPLIKVCNNWNIPVVIVVEKSLRNHTTVGECSVARIFVFMYPVITGQYCVSYLVVSDGTKQNFLKNVTIIYLNHTMYVIC